MISGREINLEARRGEDLNLRCNRLHGELVEHLEQTALQENHGLICIVIGWQHWLACITANYLTDITPTQTWLHVLPVLGFAILALLTVRCLRDQSETTSSPLAKQVARLGLVFLLLSGSAVVLTFVLGLFSSLCPALLALLSVFLFAALGILVTSRFLPAALLLAGAGLAGALVPAFGFAIYGCCWLIVLQTLGLELVRKRRLWLAEEQYRSQVLPFTRLGS